MRSKKENKILELERRKNDMMFEIGEDNFFEDENSLKGFVPSEFKWISLDVQKKRAKELANKTKKKK